MCRFTLKSHSLYLVKLLEMRKAAWNLPVFAEGCMCENVNGCLLVEKYAKIACKLLRLAKSCMHFGEEISEKPNKIVMGTTKIASMEFVSRLKECLRMIWNIFKNCARSKTILQNYSEISQVMRAGKDENMKEYQFFNLSILCGLKLFEF